MRRTFSRPTVYKSMMERKRGTATWGRWWPFASLCLLGAARGILVDAVPRSGSTLWSLTVGCVSATLIVLTWFTIVRARTITARNALCGTCAGAMLVAGPFLPPVFAVRGVESGMLVMALALTSVVVAVARPVFRHTDSAEVAGRLWPGIAAVAGLMLLLPIPVFTSLPAILCLCASPVVTGLGAVWFRSIQAPKLLRAVCGLAGASIVFAGAGMARRVLHWPQDHAVWLAAALDGAMVLLAVFALLRVGSTRWSAQFVIVPTAIIAVALLSIHTRPDPRSVAGLAVLIFSSVFLLLPPASESAELGIAP